MKLTGITLGLIFAASTSYAAVVEFGAATSTVAGEDFTFNVSTPSTVFGDAFFTFYAEGDIGSNGERVSILLDGTRYGRVFDGNTANDDFSLFEVLNPTAVANGEEAQFAEISGDNPDDNQLVVAQLRLSESLFAGLISDGSIDVELRYSRAVGNVVTGGNFSFDEIAPVPLPASLGLLGLGVAGLGALRARRRKSQRA